MAWSTDGQRIISGSNDQSIPVWDAKTGQCLHQFQSDAWVMAVASSPNGRTLASGGADCVVWLFDLETGDRLKALSGHDSWIWSMAWSPDGQSLWAVAWQPAGQLLASSADDDTIRIWEVNTGCCLKILKADRPYEGMNITGATGSTQAQKTTLKALGAVEKL